MSITASIPVTVSTPPAGQLYMSWSADILSLGTVGNPTAGIGQQQSLGLTGGPASNGGLSVQYGSTANAWIVPATVVDQTASGITARPGHTRFLMMGMNNYTGSSGGVGVVLRPYNVPGLLQTNPANSATGIYVRYCLYVDQTTMTASAFTAFRQVKQFIYRSGGNSWPRFDEFGIGTAFGGAQYTMNYDDQSLRMNNGTNQGGVNGGATWGNGKMFNTSNQSGGADQWVRFQHWWHTYADGSSPSGWRCDSKHWINEVQVHADTGLVGSQDNATPLAAWGHPIYGGGTTSTPGTPYGMRMAGAVIESGGASGSGTPFTWRTYIDGIALANRFILSNE